MRRYARREVNIPSSDTNSLTEFLESKSIPEERKERDPKCLKLKIKFGLYRLLGNNSMFLRLF